MRKYFKKFIVIVILLILVGCNKKNVVLCTIVEQDEDFYIVSPLDGEFELNSSNEYVISKNTIENVNMNDVIEITYTGGILETYPASFEKIIKVKLKIPSLNSVSQMNQNELEKHFKGIDKTVLVKSWGIPTEEYSDTYYWNLSNGSRLVVDFNSKNIVRKCRFEIE